MRITIAPPARPGFPALQPLTIDVPRLPAWLRWVPGFVRRWILSELERMVLQFAAWLVVHLHSLTQVDAEALIRQLFEALREEWG